MMLEHGIDSALSISYPLKTLIERPDWQNDDEVPKCSLCGSEFNLLNRRHHCRRCGRIFCIDCCPKGIVDDERYCLVCSAVLSIDKDS